MAAEDRGYMHLDVLTMTNPWHRKGSAALRRMEFYYRDTKVILPDEHPTQGI